MQVRISMVSMLQLHGISYRQQWVAGRVAPGHCSRVLLTRSNHAAVVISFRATADRGRAAADRSRRALGWGHRRAFALSKRPYLDRARSDSRAGFPLARGK